MFGSSLLHILVRTSRKGWPGLALALALPLGAAEPALPGRTEISALMRRVADYQIREYQNKVPLDWKAGTFFTGVTAAYQATGDRYFLDAATGWAKKANWQVRGGAYHADNICTAQTYLDLYAVSKDAARIADIQNKLQGYFAKKTITKKECDNRTPGPDERPFAGRNVWWWADALYMAPPLLARLHAATGDARYLELMHRLYWDTVAHLYVPADKLFFRDARYFSARTPGGKNVYWSRGNGWVYAGLVRVLDALPETDPRRGDYLKLFQDLTEGILKHQGADGLWRSSLNEPSWFPEKETSGTSFFCYGLLAGVNRGWLSKESALPPALKAWAGLQSCLGPDGKLGYAQGVNEKPGPVQASQSTDYTQGTFLLAASELYKLVSPRPVAKP